jgi:hypothetical protein
MSITGTTRRIEHRDIRQVVKLSFQCYQEMDLDSIGYRFDEAVIKRSWMSGVQGEVFRGYVHDNGKIAGILGVTLPVATAFYDGSPRMAQEITFHADPALSAYTRIKTMLSLLDYAITDLRDIGVESLYINSDKRYPALGKMLDSRGFKPVSEMHYRRL